MVNDKLINNLYGYPCPGRFGLGHSLLAWARCFLWCKDNNVAMLAPSWFQFRLGPYLRREKDKRAYHKLFRRGVYLQGVRRLWLIKTATSFEAVEEFQAKQAKGTRVVVFENDYGNNTRYFKKIFGRHEDVRAELLRIARPENIPTANCGGPFVGIHVRRGDFTHVSDPAQLSSTGNVQLPVEWYREILLALRQRAGSDLPARVFSDGEMDSLRPLLDLPNVSFVLPGSALHDIFVLSQACVMISSSSGFSMWASYLGQVPRVCFPNQRRERVVCPMGVSDLEPECETADQLSATFVAQVLAAFHSLDESKQPL
jgi:hypothetical protein